MLISAEEASTLLLGKQGRLRKKLREGRASARSLKYARLIELPRIEAALGRIADGSYGICCACGDRIEKDRLAAIPDIPTCKVCGGREPFARLASP